MEAKSILYHNISLFRKRLNHIAINSWLYQIWGSPSLSSSAILCPWVLYLLSCITLLIFWRPLLSFLISVRKTESIIGLIRLTSLNYSESGNSRVVKCTGHGAGVLHWNPDLRLYQVCDLRRLGGFSVPYPHATSRGIIKIVSKLKDWCWMKWASSTRKKY